jgi:sphingosine kinase
VAGSEQWAGKRVCVVVNPIGGAGHGKRVFQRVLKPMLTNAGLVVDLIETEYRGHAHRILAEVDLTKYSAVLSVSGDGMLHEMANGLWERYGSFADLPPLAPIPAGTGNGLCASFGARDPVAATQMFLRGKTKGLDMMTVTSLEEGKQARSDSSRKLAVMSVHWGLTADYDTLTEMSFRKIGNMRFLVTNVIVPWLLIYRAKSYKGRMSFVPLRNEQTDERGNHNKRYDGINHDKEQQLQRRRREGDEDTEEEGVVVIEDTFFTVVAATVPWLAHDACLAPKAELTDGYIDLMVVRGKNRGVIDEIRAFMSLESGTLLDLPFVEYFKTKKIFMEPLDDSDCGFYSIDGELVKAHPITIEAQPGMGRFVY